MENQVNANIQNLTDKRKLSSILLQSVQELKMTKKSLWQYIISIVLGFLLAVAVGFSEKTVFIVTDIAEILFNTSIAIIGIVIGAYAVFQALLQDNLILLLIKSENNLLKESNKTFLNIVILNVYNVIASLSIRILMSVIKEDFQLFDVYIYNCIVASFLIWLYLIYNILLLLEIILFSVNLYRMFCVHNTVKAIETVTSEEE